MVTDALARIPERALPDVDVADSVAYLASDHALRSIAIDPYWPKWHSPWWHALLLFELGEARQIPQRAVRALVDGLNAYPLKIFPIKEGELGGYDPRIDMSCHCALGTISQVLLACGIDVAREVPWVKPWFVTYQMADGGMNCDESAYRVEGECPSSMVGTIAAFEAMMLLAQAPEEHAFVERAAKFLVERRLVLGSPTKHNAEERAREPAWRQLCFPRFYFYDVLRGLAALARHGNAPLDVVAPIALQLAHDFPDGIVRVQRQAYAGCGSLVKTPTGWQRVPTASMFPLLDRTSVLGAPSVALTRQWTETRRLLLSA